jgi:hypothetical protein
MDSTKDSSAYVEVEDGAEVKLDLRTGQKVSRGAVYSDPDFKLSERLTRLAIEEAEEKKRVDRGERPKPPKRQRPDTPTGRLLDELEDQNEGSAFLEDTWVGTLKALADLGPAAVPELIAELDATDNRRMMSCVSFVLRAIGDKRAVPALIRAIPKTFGQSGSDMRVGCEDAELAKFAQKYDLDGPKQGNQFDFCRALLEVCGTLKKLTGKSLSEGELSHIGGDGSARQKQLKRRIFDRTAKEWADWWDAHASELIQDSAYFKVNLRAPQPLDLAQPQPGIRYKSSVGHSNWMLESILNPKARKTFIDLDTSRAVALPKKWKGAKDIESHVEEIVAWARDEGFDLMGVEYAAPDGQKYYAIRGIGLQAWELGPDRWKFRPEDITIESLQKEGTPAQDLLLHFDKETKTFDPKSKASYFYVTSEGTPGLLFVGVEVKDNSLKPGGVSKGDDELSPIAFYKGRRFGFTEFEEIK